MRKKRQHYFEGADDVKDPEKGQVEFFNVVIDKAIPAVDERFDSLQVQHNNFGSLYDMKKLNEMAGNELITKCQNLAKYYHIMIAMILMELNYLNSGIHCR